MPALFLLVLSYGKEAAMLTLPFGIFNMPQGRTPEGTGPPAPALLTHTHTSASGTRPSWRWFRFGSIPGGMNGVVGGNENERKIRLDVGSERLWLSHFGEDGRIGQQAFRSQHLLCLERSVRSHSRLSLPTQRWLHSGSLGSYHIAELASAPLHGFMWMVRTQVPCPMCS